MKPPVANPDYEESPTRTGTIRLLQADGSYGPPIQVVEIDGGRFVECCRISRAASSGQERPPRQR